MLLCRRAAALAALALLTLGSPLAAQRRRAPPRDSRQMPYVFRFLVFPTFDFLEGLSLSGTFALRKPPRRGPIPAVANWELTMRASTSGTRSIQLAFDAPDRWEGWRLLGIAGIERAQRAPYFGLGRATSLSDSAEDANGDVPYYRYGLLRSGAFVALQRTVGSPRLRLLAGARARHYRALPLEGTTLLSDDLAAGRVSAADTGRHDVVELRYGVIYDTRDEEASPTKGLLIEALGATSVSGPGYGRTLLGARAFVPVGEFTTLALRAQVESITDDAPYWLQYERLTSWRPEDGFGGPTTLRTVIPGRFLGPNRWLASVDLRYRKYDIPLPTNPVRLWLVAFADAGQVFSSSEPISLSDLTADVGTGFRLQFSKGTLFGLDLGLNTDQVWGISTGLSFSF